MQDVIGLARYGDTPAAEAGATGQRYSDEQLYALARYVYSLRPPANPNKFQDRRARSKSLSTRGLQFVPYGAALYKQ